MGSVVPGYRALLRFVEGEYLPALAPKTLPPRTCRMAASFTHTASGTFARSTLSPEEIHTTGFVRSRAHPPEMQDILRKTKFEADMPRVHRVLRTDPALWPRRRRAAQRTAYVLKRIDGELPRLFQDLAANAGMASAHPGHCRRRLQSTAYYFPSSGDGMRAGVYYVNTLHSKEPPVLLRSRRSRCMRRCRAITCKLRYSRNSTCPNSDRFGGFTSFVEGWALYAERWG